MNSMLLNTLTMLYTFCVTEQSFDRIQSYLADRGLEPFQRIFAVQQDLWDDQIIVGIDCAESTAVFLELLC
jgi:hypothetical protein